jgi:hypothetical protein
MGRLQVSRFLVYRHLGAKQIARFKTAQATSYGLLQRPDLGNLNQLLADRVEGRQVDR